MVGEEEGEDMGYDAFISYSHAADGELAPSLQRGLQRLARPWYRVRSLRVFRDETGLSVNPHLWSSIEQALDDSGYLVLLASPEAAQSPWVGREVDHWLATKPVEHILPVLTEGELVWDAEAGRFDPERSTALPPSLLRAFSEEPRHLDLRWAHTATDLDLRNPRFLEATAALAAPIHGVSKDDLAGEDIRQHRRAVRLVWGAAMLLLFVTLAAVVAASFAVNYASRAAASERRALAEQATAQRNAEEAEEQRTIALENASTATRERANAQASADEATANAEEAQYQQTLAEQNAVLAAQNAAEAQANGQAAQMKSLEAQANALEAQRNADAAAASADAARRSAADAQASADAEAAQRALAELAAADARAREAEARAAAIDARSRALAATARNILDANGDRALLLAVQAGRYGNNFQTRDSLLRVLQGQPQHLTSYLDLTPAAGDTVRGVAISPDGRTVAGVGSSGTITLADTTTGARLATIPAQTRGLDLGWPTVAEFSADGSRFVTADLQGSLLVWDVAQSRVVPNPTGTPPMVIEAALSGDGRSLAVAGAGEARVLPLDGVGPASPPMALPDAFTPFRLAISPDGTELAVGGTEPIGNENQIMVFDVASGLPSGPTLRGQIGPCTCVAEYRDILDLQFGSEGGVPTLTSVGANIDDFTVVTWDRRDGSVLHAVPTPHPLDEDVVAVSADHRHVATTTLDDGDVRVRDLATGALVGVPLAGHAAFCDATCVGGTVGARTVAFLGSGAVLVAGGDGIVRTFDPSATDPLLARTVAPGLGGDVVVMSADGSIAGTLTDDPDDPFLAATLTLVDTRTGRRLPARAVGSTNAAWVALSADGTLVATVTAPGGYGAPHRITVTDVATGAVRWSLLTDFTSVDGLTFSPDRSRLAVSGPTAASLVRSHLAFLDASSGRTLAQAQGRLGLTSGPTFVDLGRAVLIRGYYDGDFRLDRYDVATAAFIAGSTDPRLGRALTIPAAVSADGLTAALATNDRTILLIDTTTLAVRAQVTLSGTPVTVALSPDAGTVLATYANRGAQLFDAATGQPLGAPLDQASSAQAAAFADGGRTLVTGGTATPLVRTELGHEALTDLACSIVRRNLTSAEWNLLVGSEVAYETTCPTVLTARRTTR
jgi:WD40 repeat protein